ncbi:benzoate-CoA ligase family protein [Mesorhizobium sp.]|uniref:benzoate-CoA ligase family protein n=1 Tax=Mesorhizobium sp. TaxID=1871066 RepID=UPI000FE7397F|nr:benzoate-CoA ligase family protein [Mesorhizobium sp.]RWM45571.1 MAG: benzoate-CoA ligase family protein [Mesorhizobium sp.]RWM58298.1 MAG: benzoate-CoA ligase family protein [Mesorhizobium sp.]RWM58908.1 MAG: benzoate-CoA ligase family protein [Mesorhizobium sp.]TIO70162.1 MAG: benzoate-CoA ligase family protein [Mesorhizobium sp.]TJV94030.1 MAG: benzoate-CoA ligase family protein [Mesorhizobium sp.]
MTDLVSDDMSCAAEIGFSAPERYNASEILFRNLDAGRANKVAIYAMSGNVTYGELCIEAARFGNGLKSLGLKPGDRVVMFLNDTPRYPAAYFGAVRAGFVPILCNTLSNVELVRFYIEDSGASVAVVEGEYAHLFEAAVVSGTSLRSLVLVNGASTVHAAVEVNDAAKWLAGFSPDLTPADTHRDDMAFWMYSSGSTGKPKGIVHLQHDMAYTMESYGRRVLGIREDDICFSVPKIFFAYGFGNSITFPFSLGASAVLHAGRPDAAAVLDCVERFKPTLFFGLPTLYNALLGHPRAASADFGSVRLCLSAAEVLSQELFDGWKERFGLEIMEGLGSTEVLHIYLSNTVDQKKVGTAGKRVPGYDIRLTYPDGQPVPRGESGIMWVRGGSNAPTYWNRPDKTEQTMRDGWIWTGDLLVEDEAGFYTFSGRVDDLIKVSGQWVYPLEIELTLFEHEAVRECAVLGLEMPDRRMTLKAFVVLEDGHTACAEMTAALQGYVKSKLLPYKYPRIIDYVDVLPKTGTGKIDRQELKGRGI